MNILDRQQKDLSQTSMDDRALASWEIVSVTSSALIAEWMYAASLGVGRAVAAIPVVFALALMISSQRLRKETLVELGLRFDNFLRAIKLLLLPMIVATFLSVTIGWVLGGRPNFFRWRAEHSLSAQLTISIAWGFAQQYVLQSFINRRLQIVCGAGTISVLATALLFAVLHLPNPTLVIATFLGGLIWAWIYQRVPNLFALAISHSLMSWVLGSTLPESMLNHGRIGIRYFF